MSVYSVDKLMKETRRIAAQYHETTGQALPVTQELARYDAKRLLKLSDPETAIAGVDAVSAWPFGEHVQIKGRVIFREDKMRQRIGQLNMEAAWDCVVLVIFNALYDPTEIYVITREELETHLSKVQNKRGLLSVAKFKAISHLVWTPETDLQLQEVWCNESYDD